jgi:hypothetical protein
MSNDYRWTGYLRRDLASGGLIGELHDPFGFTIRLIGARADGHYAIEGIPGLVPQQYRIPVLDDANDQP